MSARGLFRCRRPKHRIMSAARKRMAAQQSKQRHPTAPQNSVSLHCLDRIFRAGGNVPAGRREQRRDGPLVGLQQLERREFCNVSHSYSIPGRGFRLPELASSEDAGGRSFCSTTVKARRISSSTAWKSAVTSDFFGFITTSASTFDGGCESRTASRKRRFMRLRSTAPPSARLTVNPTRSPDTAADPDPVLCKSSRFR